MNKPTYIAGACFILSEIFAVSSLAIVDWIHSAGDAGICNVLFVYIGTLA